MIRLHSLLIFYLTFYSALGGASIFLVMLFLNSGAEYGSQLLSTGGWHVYNAFGKDIPLPLVGWLWDKIFLFID